LEWTYRSVGELDTVFAATLRWLAGSDGPIQSDQLAALTARTLPALLRALPDLAARPRQHGIRRKARTKTPEPHPERALFAAVQGHAAI
jgi:hypothetical protein